MKLLLPLCLSLIALPLSSAYPRSIPPTHIRSLPSLSADPPDLPPPEDIFGKEFESLSDLRTSVYWKGKQIAVLPRSETSKARQSETFNRVRATLILDSLFVSTLGLCLTWYFGTLADSFSYAIGSLLGLGYANLLSKYVESIGSPEKSMGGNARFLPVILLILVYAKNKETVHIIPELLGFFSYQIGSFLQMFNANLYDEDS